MPENPDWIASWVMSAELGGRLRRDGLVEGAFDDYCRFIRSLARPDAPSKSFGSFVEVRVGSRIRGRIHAHAYVSMDPACMAGGSEMLPAKLTFEILRQVGGPVGCGSLPCPMPSRAVHVAICMRAPWPFWVRLYCRELVVPLFFSGLHLRPWR